ADVWGTYSVSVGQGSDIGASADYSAAFGYDADVLTGHDYAYVFGTGTDSGGSNQFIIGNSTNEMSVGISTNNMTNLPTGSLHVGSGALCVDDNAADCDNDPRTAGYIYAESNSIGLIDLAENYPSNQDLEPGEVVTTDPDNPVYVIRSTGEYQQEVIGVVSTNPGVLLGGFSYDEYPAEQLKPIALSGRVPTKVNSENGPIEVGDPLTSSSVPGVAMKATASGPIIGKALEAFSDPDPTVVGQVMVFISVGWYVAPVGEGDPL
ncbi:unnamed protein product, partial [marine sediment metagenome]